MTPGHAHVWKEIKVLPESPVCLTPSLETAVNEENRRWQTIVESQAPREALVPMPTDSDAAKYPEFADLADDVSLLRSRLKMTYLESLVLHRLARTVPEGGTILEIGSGSGGSLAVMALASPAVLWAIDPFTPYDETNCGPTARGVTEGNENEFWETARHYEYSKRIRQIKENSDVASSRCPRNGFDLVLVDGNHTYEIVKSDLNLYWPKVKRGGMLVVHDYTARFPGVIRAMQEWGIPYSVIAGTSLCVAKK